MNKKEIILSIITVFFSVIIVTVAVAATGGLLTPPSAAFDGGGAPQGTMHTLEDIYVKAQQTQLCNATTDTATGIMWQNDPGVAIPWQDASGLLASDGVTPTGAGYCDKLTMCGVTWRLPTKVELEAGLNAQFVTSPATLAGFQTDYNYWSSTPYADIPGFAWNAGVNSYGNVGTGGDLMTNQSLVRCIH